MRIKFFLDESGNEKSHFFGIGGLYYYFENDKSSSLYKTNKVLNKLDEMQIWSNFRYLSKEIKKTIPDKNIKEELKAWETNHAQKEFFFSNLKNWNQNAISMFCDNVSWNKWKRNKTSSNINLKYNYLLKIMLERFIRDNTLEIRSKFPDGKILIELTCDERGSATKFSRPIQDYLNEELNKIFITYSLKIQVSINFVHSNSSLEIQYADFIVNLVFLSMYEIYQIKPNGYHDEKILEIYDMFHRRINCNKCHTLSIAQNQKCKSNNIIVAF